MIEKRKRNQGGIERERKEGRKRTEESKNHFRFRFTVESPVSTNRSGGCLT